MAEGEETKSDVRTSFGFWPEEDAVTRAITVGGRVGGCVGCGLAWERELRVEQSPSRLQAPLPACPPIARPPCVPAGPAAPQERIHRTIGIPQQFGEGLYGACAACRGRPHTASSTPGSAARPQGLCRAFTPLAPRPPPPPPVLNYQLGQKYEAHNDHCMDGYLGNRVRGGWAGGRGGGGLAGAASVWLRRAMARVQEEAVRGRGCLLLPTSSSG